MAAKSIRKRRPSRTKEFTTSILDELTKLTERGMRKLLHNVDQKDAIYGLLGASQAVRDRFFAQFDDHVRDYIIEQMEVVGADADADEIREAQERIIGELRLIQPRRGKLPPEYGALKRGLKKMLQQTSVSEMDEEELTRLFTELAEVSSIEGVLALEEFLKLVERDQKDTLVSFGLSGTVAGGLRASAEVLERRLDTSLQERRRRGQMMIDGITGLVKRSTPEAMRLRLRSHYTLQDRA